MSTLLLTAAVAQTIGCGTALANSERTDQLLWKCTMRDGKTPPEVQIANAQCLSYIDGILDMHAMMVAFAKSKPQFCLPAQGVSLDQAHKIFVKWANDNPKELHQTARSSVLIALKQAFPCKGK